MRQALVWLMVFGVIVGLSTRFATAADHHLAFTHSHEHEGGHHHHPQELPGHDGCGGEECPDTSHEHQHVVCCSPLVWVIDRAENEFCCVSSGGHLALVSFDEAPPDGPYLELDTPPLI